ncbi:MAG: hypothetical protein LBT56_05315 [Prevotellaceae bacterium]|jgi:ABC-type transport system involved in cytochrome bd biosynthesis fused ATPase/permease subunit|nr:hypothetical protein [Prevotellaceae bacterium]
MEEKNNIQENKNSGISTTKIFRQIITGRMFVSASIQKHLGYILLLFFLAVFYIGYRYKVESTARENKEIDNEIKLLHPEYIYKSKELMIMGRKSEVLKQIQKRNLTIKESKNPFIRIKTK